MKKLPIAGAMAGVLLGAAISVHSAIRSPAAAAARNLAAINGLTVGITTEAELLTRPEFQTIDRKCFEAHCMYFMDTENALLAWLHLAPRTHITTLVTVSDGMVIDVTIFIMRAGLTPISIVQMSQMPSWCSSSPCASPVLPNKMWEGNRVLIGSDSPVRNRMPETINTACLSRIHGCNSYAELVPIAKDLSLKASAQ